MIYLILSVICNAMIGIVMRFSQGRVKGSHAMLSVNYIICLIAAAYDTGISNVFTTQTGAGLTAVLGVITGLFFFLSLVYNQKAIASSGIVLSSILAKLGALLIPLLYRFRMAEFVILDEPRARGLSAMLISSALLRRRCWQLFRLDLRFWWYYGLKALCLLLCYADLLLATLGISLPIGEDAAYFLTFGLYLAALFVVEVSFRPQVDTAYAVTYEGLKAIGPFQKKPAEEPGQMPWDEA